MYKLFIGFPNCNREINVKDITEDEIENCNILAYIEKKNYYLYVKFMVEKEKISFGCCVQHYILKKRNYYYYLRKNKIYYFNTYYKYYLHNMKKYPKIDLEELTKFVFSPKRIKYLLETYDIDVETLYV